MNFFLNWHSIWGKKGKKNLYPYFATYTKINWGWIIDVKASDKTIKHLEKKQKKNLNIRMDKNS